jgi:hypothetical protein
VATKDGLIFQKVGDLIEYLPHPRPIIRYGSLFYRIFCNLLVTGEVCKPRSLLIYLQTYFYEK